MNGAQALVRTLARERVEVCFANPGTSEMHFVAALDTVPEMRSVLALFEGVASGAADGYGRMAGKPAASLVHLGVGLGNSLANLHNARRAHTPLVNIVGDHATYHLQYDAQLTSDIHTVARNVSSFIRAPQTPAEVGPAAADAVAAAFGPPGQVATLILPADASWLDGAQPAPPAAITPPSAVGDAAVDDAARALRSGEPAVLLIGDTAMQAAGLEAASRIAKATGARLFGETFPRRTQRGEGLPSVDRLGYLAEFTMAQLDGAKHLVLAGAKAPVSFFGYPDKPSWLVPEGCEVHTLAGVADDIPDTLARLADEVAGGVEPDRQAASRPDRPTGPLTAEAVGAAVGALLPEGAIVSDEANTAGLFAPRPTAGAPRHDWLTLTGGGIGQGLPVATGAALACPDRKVVALEADGSAMYTLQALWTQAREGLDVTTVIFNNQSYAILQLELSRVGAAAGGPKAADMLDLSRPNLDFVSLANGMGVEASRADTAEAFTKQLEAALADPGPHLIEAVLPRGL